MSDDAEHGGGHAEGPHAGRTTSPMQDYTTAQVAYGAIVLLVGIALTFGLGFVL